MYIKEIKITNVRTIESAQIQFRTPDDPPEPLKQGATDYPNVTLFLGNNGAGKTTILRSIALAVLGSVAEKMELTRTVRRVPKGRPSPTAATVSATFSLSEQDLGVKKARTRREAKQMVSITRKGPDFEMLRGHPEGAVWEPLFENRSPAFFLVGYGATRRVEPSNNVDIGARGSQSHSRIQRIQSLFQDSWGLLPLEAWLPTIQANEKKRYQEIIKILNSIMPDGYGFEGRRDKSTGEYLFSRDKLDCPLTSLSDGPKAFIGWVGDLLYHICFAAPPSLSVHANRGIVLIDEVDLHIHPEWQREIVPALSRAFPNLQFIFTTHSPLVVGSLTRKCIWTCERTNAVSVVAQPEIPVQGLSADQILVTDYFSLKGTRNPEKEAQLDKIARDAEHGVSGASTRFLRELVSTFD